MEFSMDSFQGSDSVLCYSSINLILKLLPTFNLNSLLVLPSCLGKHLACQKLCKFFLVVATAFDLIGEWLQISPKSSWLICSIFHIHSVSIRWKIKCPMNKQFLWQRIIFISFTMITIMLGYVFLLDAAETDEKSYFRSKHSGVKVGWGQRWIGHS